MAPERRNQIILAALSVVLLGAIYRAMPTSPAATVSSGAAGPTSETRRAGSRNAGDAAARLQETPDVRLEALNQERVAPVAAGQRNLFEFRRQVVERVAPPPERSVVAPPPARSVTPVPTVPPITLKFIGVVEATEKSQTYAVLRDDRGVYHGREGDVIEGRYRILRIGAESIELSYVDGQGRQTIRLGS